MKKKLITLLLVMPFMMTACSSGGSDAPETDGTNPTPEVQPSRKPVLMARTEAVTRTTLGTDRYALWSADDNMTVFLSNATPEKYVIESGAGTTAATFKSTTPETAPGAATFAHMAAVYPFAADCIMAADGTTGYKFDNVMFPAVQNYRAGSFDDNTAPMIAVSATTDLQFKNLGGLLKLQFTKAYDYTVGSMEITDRGGEPISGKCSVSIANDGLNPMVTLAPDAATTINYICKGGVTLDTATPQEFYIVLPPVNFYTGLQIVIKDPDGGVINTLRTKPFKMERNNIRILPVLELKGEGITGEITPGDVLPA